MEPKDISISSVSDLISCWENVEKNNQSAETQQKQVQIKNQMLSYLKSQKRFSEEDAKNLEVLKAKIQKSGDSEFLEKIAKATKRLVFTKPTPVEERSPLE